MTRAGATMAINEAPLIPTRRTKSAGVSIPTSPPSCGQAIPKTWATATADPQRIAPIMTSRADFQASRRPTMTATGSSVGITQMAMLRKSW